MRCHCCEHITLTFTAVRINVTDFYVNLDCLSLPFDGDLLSGVIPECGIIKAIESLEAWKALEEDGIPTELFKIFDKLHLIYCKLKYLTKVNSLMPGILSLSTNLED